MTGNQIIPVTGFSEPFSSILHLLAAAVFFVLGIFLMRRGRGHAGHVFALGVFSFSIVFLLSMSGVFHLLEPGGTSRAVLQRLDHAGIFFLIAGTFTPIHGLLFTRSLRWGILFLIWTIAITGIVLKSIYFNEIAEWIGLSIYLGMGWIGALTAILLYRRFNLRFIKYLLLGSVAYTVGAICEFLRYPVLVEGVIGPHEIFHVFIILGISFHFTFVFQFANREEQKKAI